MKKSNWIQQLRVCANPIVLIEQQQQKIIMETKTSYTKVQKKKR